jgi:hypothetical protein
LAVEHLKRLERLIYLEPTVEVRRRGREVQTSGMLTPKEGKVVEPASWGKDSVEGRRRPVVVVGMGETSFLLSIQVTNC